MPFDDPTGPVFGGRYGDGRAAETSAVDVRLTATGLEITRVASTGTLVWPFEALTASVPIGRHAIDVLLGCRYVPEATLFVAEGSFARQLRTRAPHLKTSSVRMRDAAPWLLTTLVIAIIGGLISFGGLSPARAVARLIPDGTRAALGAQVIGSLTANRKVCAAPAGRAALDRLVGRLSQAANGTKPFTVMVLDWGLVNAFAAPGEQIVLTRGLIAKAESADEVAGVLAHEMGHGLELHPESGLVRAVGMSAAAELVFGGSAGALGNIGVLLAQLSYTRDAERAADRQALRILRESAISAQGIADFFTRVTKEEGGRKASSPRAFDVLSTHPQSAERAQLVASQPPYPATPALTAEEWAALRAICGGARAD